MQKRQFSVSEIGFYGEIAQFALFIHSFKQAVINIDFVRLFAYNVYNYSYHIGRSPYAAADSKGNCYALPYF